MARVAATSNGLGTNGTRSPKVRHQRIAGPVGRLPTTSRPGEIRRWDKLVDALSVRLTDAGSIPAASTGHRSPAPLRGAITTSVASSLARSRSKPRRAKPAAAAHFECGFNDRPNQRRGGTRGGRRATTTPDLQPGARPPAGGRTASASRPLDSISHEISEFEFHISPAASSSRPQTGVGTSGTRSRIRSRLCISSRLISISN